MKDAMKQLIQDAAMRTRKEVITANVLELSKGDNRIRHQVYSQTR